MKLTFKEKILTYSDKIKIEELKTSMIIEQGSRCFVCNKPFSCNNLPEVAHRIPKGKRNYKKFSYEVINHRDNLRVTCPGACNSSVIINPATKRLEAKELERSILNKLGVK